MKKSFGRLGGTAALIVAATLASGPLMAGQEVELSEHADRYAEDTLLGVHLLTSTFRDVLQKYGQPTEIQAGGPYAPTPPEGASNASAGAAAGGPGLPGMMGGPATGGMGGMMSVKGGGAAPGGGASSGGSHAISRDGFTTEGGGGGGAAGGPMGPGGGSTGGMMGMMGAKMGGKGGGMGPMSGGGVGLPGFGGGMSAGGDEGGAPTPGAGNAPTSGAVKETTWWYHDHQKGIHFAFVFNRTGNVIQIGEYGPRKFTAFKGRPVPGAGVTKKGIALGSSMGMVLNRYGFSLEGAHSAEKMIMRYGKTDKLAVQLVNNVVLGITIGVTK